MTSEKMYYVELIRKLKEEEINPDNFTFKKCGEDNSTYFYDKEIHDLYYKNNMGKLYLSDEYSPVELFSIVMVVTKNSEKILTEGERLVLKDLEKIYTELDHEIDCCQGCMEGLDDAFEQLNVLSDLMSYVSGNGNYVKENESRMIDELYARFKEQKEEEENRKNVLFEPVKSGMEFLMSENKKDKVVWNLIQKVNDILRYLKENENK